MARILPFFVLTILLLLSRTRSDDSSFRENCWESYVATKLCIPKYDKCLMSMGKNCFEVFTKCVENHTTSISSSTCQQSLQNFTEDVRKNKISYAVNLLERATSEWSETTFNENICDVSVLKHHKLFLFNVSALAMRQVEKLPRLIRTFCQCPNRLGNGFSVSDSTAQSRQTSIPIHLWYGGFQNYKCWKEIDRYLAETLCGEASAFLINHEWAKRMDCLENPATLNCSTKFLERLQTISVNSEKRLFCSVYVEIVANAILLFNYTSFDYKVVYVESNVVSNVHYRNDELYLIIPSNEDVGFQCFSGKRALNSCFYSYFYCSKISQNQCDEIFMNCLEDENALSESCVSVLIPRTNIMRFSGQFLDLIWEHKGKIFGVCFVTLLIGCSKMLRNWIAKEIGIKTCTSLTKRFDEAIVYFDRLLPTDDLTQSTARSTSEDREDDMEEEEHGEGNGLLPADDQISTPPINQNSDNDPNSNNYVGYIQKEFETIQNNEAPASSLLDSASTESLAKVKSDTPKGKPKLPSAFKAMVSSFVNMIISIGKAFYILFILPAFDFLREKTIGCRNGPEAVFRDETSLTTFSDKTGTRILIED